MFRIIVVIVVAVLVASPVLAKGGQSPLTEHDAHLTRHHQSVRGDLRDLLQRAEDLLVQTQPSDGADTHTGVPVSRFVTLNYRAGAPIFPGLHPPPTAIFADGTIIPEYQTGPDEVLVITALNFHLNDPTSATWQAFIRYEAPTCGSTPLPACPLVFIEDMFPGGVGQTVRMSAYRNLTPGLVIDNHNGITLLPGIAIFGALGVAPDVTMNLYGYLAPRP